MPVGNDIVDLQDPDSQPDAIHTRFDRRAFSPPDLELLADARDEADRHRLRWTLWAVREAAFKCLRQEEPSTRFRPREYVVRLSDDGTASVTAQGRDLVATIDGSDQRIHAVVGPAGTDALSGVRRFGVPPAPDDASREVRADAADTVGRLLDIDPDSVQIVRESAGSGTRRAPLARRGRRVLPVDVSLSHHGHWVAHAVSLSR